MNGNGYISGSANDWAPPHNQLEGPGMPVARPYGALSATPGPLSEPLIDVNDGDAEGDGDDKQYCFCNRVSFGEMIACDEPSCEVEWVRYIISSFLFLFSVVLLQYHIQCIGLTVAPEGAWICDTCANNQAAKKNGRRSARGGKRKAGGNRAGARAASGA